MQFNIFNNYNCKIVKTQTSYLLFSKKFSEALQVELKKIIKYVFYIIFNYIFLNLIILFTIILIFQTTKCYFKRMLLTILNKNNPWYNNYKICHKKIYDNSDSKARCY